jgi:hypothetical protein
MIYKNYELYDFKKDPNFIEFKEYCDKLGYPVALKRSPKSIKKVNKVGGGHEKRLKPIMIEFEATERSVGGSAHWRYSTTPIIHDKHGVPKFDSEYATYFDKMRHFFQEEDLELLWFICRKTNLVKTRKDYDIEDKEKDYRERLDKQSDKIGVEFYILNPQSPLTDTQIRIIAKSFGLTKVDEMSEARLRNELYDHVDMLQRNARDGYKQFMEATKLDHIIVQKAKVQDAIDAGIVGWYAKNNSWMWLDADGNPVDVLCTLRVDEEPRKVDVLLDFILADKELSHKIDFHLNNDSNPSDVNVSESEEVVEDNNPVGIDLSKLRMSEKGVEGSYSYHELGGFCQEIPGFKLVGSSYPSRKEALLEFHGLK